MSRVYNFSAGPAVLPEEVLAEAAAEMMDYQGCGMSVMEMSHRSAPFQKIIDEAEEDLRDLLSIPENYKVLFLQGGASQQFSAIPMNFSAPKNGVADYIVTGQWAKKAFQEAGRFITANKIATATLLVWFYRITYPVMILFNGITNTVVRLFGHDPANEHDVYTDEELRLLIDESTESGFIDPDQNEFFDNIFDLSDKDAEVIMTPRTDMVCLDLEKPLEENLETISQHKYTRYPVCRGSKDDIVGFVHMKDLYGLPVDTPIEDWKLREIPAVPETISIARLLGTMQERRTEICVVIDEHGGTAGIVTMSDVMEQIVGRIEDEYVHYPDEDVVMLHDGTYLVDGAMVINDFEDLLGFEPEEAEEVETAGGLMMALFDRIPDAGDTTTLESRDTIVNFTILDMDRFRIDKIAVKIQKKEQPAKDESSSERSSDSWKSKVQKSERD